MEEVFTTKEAADFLRLSVRELQKLCKQRRISFCQVSRRKRHFTKEQLEDYLTKVTVRARERKVDRSRSDLLPFSRKGGETTPTSLQGDTGKGFSAIRKELSTL
jgi:excisionase family DNA binding protein